MEKVRRLELALALDVSTEREARWLATSETGATDRERIAVMPKENRR